MTTTEQLIERAKAGLGVSSDYALAKALGVSHTTIAHWRFGRSRPDDLAVIRIAKLLHRDPGQVIAELHAERAKCEETRALWKRIALQLSSPLSVSS